MNPLVAYSFGVLSLSCAGEEQAKLVRKLGELISVDDWLAHRVPKDVFNELQSHSSTIKLGRTTSLANILIELEVPTSIVGYFTNFSRAPICSSLSPTPIPILPSDSKEKDPAKENESILAQLDVKEMLATAPVCNVTHIEEKDQRWVMEQSCSTTFRSCYSLKENETRTTHHDKRDSELIPFQKNELFYWTIGNLYSEDKKGFAARAKLRVFYEINNPNARYLYIEKPYGNSFHLALNIHELEAWWADKTKREGWENKGIYTANRIEARGIGFKALENSREALQNSYTCPSLAYGYRDTVECITSHSTNIYEVTYKNGIRFLLQNFPSTWINSVCHPETQSLLLLHNAEYIKTLL